MTSTFFLPAGGSFLHSPRSRLARFEGRGEKLFIVSLMALAGILRERVAVLSKLFMRIVPKYLGTLTFSLNFRNIKWRKGGPLQGRLFVPTLRQQIRGGGEVPVRLFQIRTAYEAHWGRQAEQDYLQRKTVEKGDIP